MAGTMIAGAVLVAFVAVVPSPALADQASCNNAIDRYNSAVSEIDYCMKRYARCIDASRGTDECYSEFRRLKNAQGDFESAVSDYRSECDS
jgi:hypothetical protein